MQILRAAWKVGFAALLALQVSASAEARNLTIEDLLGRWCGDVTNYTFTYTQLNVVRLDGQGLKHGPVLLIAKVEGTPTQIDVHWTPVKPGNFTRFQFSPDKRQLIQVAQTEGDKGPRRVFNRC